LTIEAPTPSSQGGGRGGSGWGSPLGGYNQSGEGREKGPDQLEATSAVRKRRLLPLDHYRTAIVAVPVPATASSGFGRQPTRRSHLRTTAAPVFRLRRWARR
ncbi:unnamed protein product, partial [Ectocarpus sp. 6 AP-2014]